MVGSVTLHGTCARYRTDLHTGRQQRNTDYLTVPVGQGTSYFLYPGANLSPEQTDDAAIGVERRLDGCVVEIPVSFKFQPEPPNQPTSGLIPILNEEHCMKANGTPF